METKETQETKLNEVLEDKNNLMEICEKILGSKTREGHAMKTMGVELLDCGPGWAKGELVIRSEHMNPVGSVHGGVMFLMADSIGGIAACTRGYLPTTSTGTINFLNAAMNPEKLIAKATELKAGKNLMTYEVYIYDDHEKLIAKATMEYYSLHIPITNADFLYH